MHGVVWRGMTWHVDLRAQQGGMKGLPMMLWCNLIVFHNRHIDEPDVSRVKSLDFESNFLTFFRPLGEYFCFPCVLYVFNYPFNRSWSIINV